MKLKKQYEQYAELYKNKYAFDPENETFFTKDKTQFVVMPGYESWKVEEMDFDAYFNDRLTGLGIDQEANEIELFDSIGAKKNQKTTERVFVSNRFGDIEILQYSLHRKAYTVGENRERYVYQTRLNPWHENICESKYDFTHGRNTPFWHKSLIEAFEQKTQIDTLVITEGQFKAFKASMDGIDTVGLTSISHFRNKENRKIHTEIIEFIKVCGVKKLVILWDGDCREISLKALEAGEDVTKRPNDFYRYARAIRELIQEFFPAKKLEVYFATIQSKNLTNEPKGIDDLLVEFSENLDEIKNDFERIGTYPGKYIEWINITNESGIKKMREWFLLSSVNSFYQYHSEKIKQQSFVWLGSTYKIEKGAPQMEVPKNLKSYKRIGTDYYMLQNKPVPAISIHNENERMYEEVLVPWTIGAITADHGKDADRHIERYHGFTNEASHTDYQQVIDGYWNLYFNIKHETRKGDFPYTEKLLRHLFQEHYENEMILDYLTILYRYPMQKLPVICLVSKEQSTGKSTFIYLLKLIFKQNMAIIANNDLTSDFNSHWTSKLIVASEETILEKKDGYEKIKSISTAKETMRNEKNKTAASIPCMVHFVFCSNHENDFIKIDDYDSRLWIRKVGSINEKIKNFDLKLQDEIPFFVDFIQNREIKYQSTGDRMFFAPMDFRTEAFNNVVRHSEPGVIKEIREKLTENFLKWRGDQRLMTVDNLKQYFGIKGENNYLNKVIKQYLHVDRFKNAEGKDAVTTYDFVIDELSDPTQFKVIKDKGRPFVFHPKNVFLDTSEWNEYLNETNVEHVQNVNDHPKIEEPKDNELPF